MIYECGKLPTRDWREFSFATSNFCFVRDGRELCLWWHQRFSSDLPRGKWWLLKFVKQRNTNWIVNRKFTIQFMFHERIVNRTLEQKISTNEDTGNDCSPVYYSSQVFLLNKFMLSKYKQTSRKNIKILQFQRLFHRLTHSVEHRHQITSNTSTSE